MPPRFEVRVSGPARRDIAAIVKLSIQEFGEAAARRYEALILQALRDLEADPDRAGSKERPDLMIEGARTYRLEYSRSRVKGQSVRTPRHFLLYRRVGKRAIEVGRILHDARDLDRNLPQQYRRSS